MQTFGNTEHSTELSNIFTENQNLIVFAHGLSEACVDRLGDRHFNKIRH